MDNKQSSRKKNGGLGIVSTLTLILAVLKVFDLISISWLWVISPIWISMLLVALLFIGFYLITKAKGKW